MNVACNLLFFHFNLNSTARRRANAHLPLICGPLSVLFANHFQLVENQGYNPVVYELSLSYNCGKRSYWEIRCWRTAVALGTSSFH